MKMVTTLLRRFGGISEPDKLPDDADKMRQMDSKTARLNAKLKAIEVDIDVMARRRVNINSGE